MPVPPGHAPGSGPVTLGALLDGRVPYVVTTAEDVPDPLPDGVTMVVLGPGERREVLLGWPGGLTELPEGTGVGVSGARPAALLRAHHPALRPVSPEGAQGVVIRPLWEDPSLEPSGEVLEWDSWLPAAGQGIPVLLHADVRPAGLRPDSVTAAILAGERAVARALPDLVLCVRGQGFGEGIRYQALALSFDGRQAVRAEAQGPTDDVLLVAEALVARLKARGADRVRRPAGP